MANQVSCDPPWPDVRVAQKQAAAVEGVLRLLELEQEAGQLAVALQQLELAAAAAAAVRTRQAQRFAQPGSGLFRRIYRPVLGTPCRCCHGF